MFKRFLQGFCSVLPFFYVYNYEIKHYPDYTFVNDWKIVGNLIKNIVNNKLRTQNDIQQ